MIRAHVDAFLAQIRLDDELADTTFDGDVTGTPDRYCVVTFNSGDRYGDRLTGPEVAATFRAGVRSVGATRDQAQFVAERVFAQVMNVHLEVPGRQLGLIRHAGGQPTTKDDTVTPPLFVATDFFEFDSDPI
ncbi:hypothetical protein [Leifsonia sp. 71-9]|uniref:hypothetical protein n=1 Tax=Leifsonia sp. 71-9 TaxID=1895934 RepID=UPI000925C2DD|nr:hypothetical protein [Leifsonia sp. 71-9]OJX72829.1 MAG: hypothetical protein BGO91_13755 [Leifsonia sp. 71-9]